MTLPRARTGLHRHDPASGGIVPAIGLEANRKRDWPPPFKEVDEPRILPACRQGEETDRWRQGRRTSGRVQSSLNRQEHQSQELADAGSNPALTEHLAGLSSLPAATDRDRNRPVRDRGMPHLTAPGPRLIAAS